VTAASAVQLAERERNRLLRRVDWRFLLAQPVVDRVLCLAGDDLRDGCRLAATHVDVALAESSGPYDVVVTQDADDDTLAKVFERLRGGGELYSEWSTAQDHDGIRRRLAVAGFSDIRLYWPWPAPPNAEVWVPLDAPMAFGHYLATDRHVYSGWRHRLGTQARRALATWQLDSGRVVPLCVVARARGDADDPAAEPGILQAVRASRQLDQREERLTCALLTGGPRAISKVVGLVYSDHAPTPAFVIKWPRVEESAAGLEREAEALAASHTSGVVVGIPRLLGRTGSGVRLAVAETAARGAPMFTRVSRATLAPLAREGASWLAGFHATHRRAPCDAVSWNARTTHAMARFADTFDAVIDPALLDETTSALAFPGEGMADVIEHRDFGPWNILVEDTGALTVLDWESSRVHGLPLLDLIYFVTYMAFFVDGAMVSRRFAESYRVTLDPRSSTGALRAELMERYRQRFGISVAMERALRALCWIEHADSEFQHFTADAGGRPPDDALRASVFVQLWKEEMSALRR